MWYTLIFPLGSAISLMNSAHYLGINSSFNFLRKGYFQLFRALVFKLFWLCIPMGKIGKHEKIYKSYLHMKVMINLDSILKSRDITLSTKVHLVKAMVSVVMYGCESWTTKKAERQRIDAFELWCWRRLLRVPLDCKEIQPVHPKGDQSWVFIGRTDVEAETPILWPPDAKSWLIWKDPDAWERLRAGGDGDNRGWDGWMASLTQWSWVWASSGRWWWTGSLACCSPQGHKDSVTRWLSDMTEWLNI